MDRSFGDYVRSVRQQREISLRKMAQMMDVSFAYLSRVERGLHPPPTEDRCRQMAEILDVDPDDLISRAGRVPRDVAEIIRSDPVSWVRRIRGVKKG